MQLIGLHLQQEFFPTIKRSNERSLRRSEGYWKCRGKKKNALGSESQAPSLQDSICPCIGDANTLVCSFFCKLGGSCGISSGTGSKGVVPQSLW